MIVWHQVSLRAVPSGEDESFLKRQLRFRTITSSLIGVVGLAVVAGKWLTDPLVSAYYWLAVLGTICAIILMALIDAMRTRQFFATHDLGVKEACKDLAAELKRINRDKKSSPSDG